MRQLNVIKHRLRIGPSLKNNPPALAKILAEECSVIFHGGDFQSPILKKLHDRKARLKYSRKVKN